MTLEDKAAALHYARGLTKAVAIIKTEIYNTSDIRALFNIMSNITEELKIIEKQFDQTQEIA